MQTFEQIQQQILDLQKQAETMRKQAVVAAVKEIKRLVNLYSLNYYDLGIVANPVGNKKASSTKAKAAPKKVAKPSKSAKKTGGSDKRSAVAPKYRDPETGQTWTGRGKPPTWLATKLATGASKDSFKL